MSAKFIDQIETSKACAARNSVPAEAIRPRIVSRSGRPAATSDPNASTRIAIVTGQREQLRLHHRVLVRLVEVGPHAGCAGEAHADAVAGEVGQLALEVVCCLHHHGGAGRRAGLEHDRAPVAGDPGAPPRTPRGRLPVRIVGRLRRRPAAGSRRRCTTDHQRVAGLPAEGAVDPVPGRDGLGAARLPAGAGERVLGPRREDAEADRDHDPGDHDEPHVPGHPVAEAADRPERAHWGAPFEKQGVRRSANEAGQSPART